MENIILIAILVVIVFLILKKTNLISSGNTFNSKKKYYTEDDQYNAQRIERQHEIDRILEKISQKGIDSINKREKQLLEDYSKK